MAIFRGSVYSRCLDMRTDLTVMLPSDSEPTPPQGIVFLLHGLSDNSHCWEERTMLPIFAEENNVAVIMPEVQRSLSLIHILYFPQTGQNRWDGPA